MEKTDRLCILAALSTVLLIAMFVSPACAITYGIPDEDDHPYVCMVVFYNATDSPLWYASGSLISPDVVLTAGHATSGADHARVWFESNISGTGWPDGGSTSIEGAVYTNPDHDVGVVVLSDVPDIDPAVLPEEGLADTLPKMSPVDLIGYGGQWQVRGGGVFPYDAWRWSGLRYYAPAQYISSEDILRTEYLKLTANPGRGKGGIAFGDSGGPVLLRGTDTILGINSFVTNYNCAGVTYAQRLDLPDILSWIGNYIEP